MNTRILTVALAGITALALAGCTGSIPGATTSSSPSAATATTAFLNCLTSAGVDAKVNDTGQVLVKYALKGELTATSSTPTVLVTETGPDGTTWVAATTSDAFSDAPATESAYATCQQQHPEFTQPQPKLEDQPDLANQQTAALAFAQCARKNGYPQIADPGANGLTGVILIPAGFSESDFRALAKSCFKAEHSFGIAGDPSLTYDPGSILFEGVNK